MFRRVGAAPASVRTCGRTPSSAGLCPAHRQAGRVSHFRRSKLVCHLSTSQVGGPSQLDISPHAGPQSRKALYFLLHNGVWSEDCKTICCLMYIGYVRNGNQWQDAAAHQSIRLTVFGSGAYLCVSVGIYESGCWKTEIQSRLNCHQGRWTCGG